MISHISRTYFWKVLFLNVQHPVDNLFEPSKLLFPLFPQAISAQANLLHSQLHNSLSQHNHLFLLFLSELPINLSFYSSSLHQNSRIFFSLLSKFLLSHQKLFLFEGLLLH